MVGKDPRENFRISPGCTQSNFWIKEAENAYVATTWSAHRAIENIKTVHCLEACPILEDIIITFFAPNIVQLVTKLVNCSHSYKIRCICFV